MIVYHHGATPIIIDVDMGIGRHYGYRNPDRDVRVYPPPPPPQQQQRRPGLGWLRGRMNGSRED